MGRTLLAAAALLLLVTCDAERPQPPKEGGDAHADLACAACHNGEKTPKSRASVTREPCAASGCHEEGGAERVTLATATFEHRNHAAKSEITINCAGCHTHAEGKAPLKASVDACALCHSANLAGKSPQECQLCHKEPSHVALTSQGIPISHSSLPWLETGCGRCHYDVMQPQKKIAVKKCLTCHEKEHEITRQAIAEDLHPTHRGITCTGCHEAGLHRVTEMSSAVSLNCADCHTRDHDQPTTAASTQTCNSCHEEAHQIQQRLVLGMLEDGRILPSSKFMTGATCRSCHIPRAVAAANTTAPRRGQAEACAGCHETEYGRVLDWWLDGVRAREAQARRYVTNTRVAIGGNAPDSAEALLHKSLAALNLVRDAGGQHNLELADMIFRESVANAANAYKLAGRSAPALPQFGNTPHVGTCSFCHYGSKEGWNYQQMPRGLHERLTEQR